MEDIPVTLVVYRLYTYDALIQFHNMIFILKISYNKSKTQIQFNVCKWSQKDVCLFVNSQLILFTGAATAAPIQGASDRITRAATDLGGSAAAADDAAYRSYDRCH